MDILELEKKYSELQDSLTEPSSNRIKLLRISDFFNQVLSLPNPNLAEVYISSLFSRYLFYIKSIKIRGLDPEILSTIIKQFEKIIVYNFVVSYKEDINQAQKILENKYKLLSSWLNETIPTSERNIIYFPVLEKTSFNKKIGFLEIIKVEILDGDNGFSIEPSDSEIDALLKQQLHLCWENAIIYCKKHIKKIKSSHSVHLKFENISADYIGNSLGIAVTLAFIEAILKYYNSKLIVIVNDCIAVTGGIDNDSNIISTSKEIIETKVETVFYSDAKIFCVPKNDQLWADEKFFELKKKYPSRDLEIVGLKDLEDLLSRRNVVDIRTQKIIVRSVKFIKKYWISALISVLLAILLAFLYVMDFDDNPVMFKQDGYLLNILNKKGKTLWSVSLNFDPKVIGQNLTVGSRKVIDIDGDGMNEVLICEEDFSYEDIRRGRIVCFDNKKEVVWEYNFKDTVSTFRLWTNNYFISIIDTLTILKTKALLLKARNEPNFPNAVFTIDLNSGKRLDSLNTLWNAGGITNSIIGDYNEDGIKELVLGGLNNGYECAIFFSVNVDRIKGQTPSTERYVFKGNPMATLNNYILLPHSDYGKLMFRNNVVPYNTLYFDSKSKEFQVSTYDGLENPILFHYRFDKDFNFLWVDCADNAQQMRDSLVSQGKLNPPFTNTNEYFKILRDQIRYWDGGIFLSIDEYLKKYNN